MDPYDFILQKTQEAGDLLMRLREEKFETDIKGGNPRDIVTSVDTAVNNFLLEEIKKVFPGDGIYSEEGPSFAEAMEGGGDSAQDQYLWVIDPIDGSSNFSRGIPHFSVCLGILKDGVPAAGAVYNPVTKELFSFKKGAGAFLNGKPIRVSAVAKLTEAQVVFSPGSRRPELWDWAAASYRKLLEHSLKRGMYGSSALDLCFIAAGRADAGVYGTLSTLDVAAAFGILYEAGGAACGADGQPVVLSTASQKVFMGNSPAMAEAVRSLLES